MRVVTALLGGSSDPDFVTGTPEEQARARAESMRKQFNAAVMASDLTEIPRKELEFHKRGIIEHVASPDGDWYTADSTGTHPAYVPDAEHYYFDAHGNVVLLKPAPGRVTSRRAFEQHQAARERQRVEQKAAAKERRRKLIEGTR